MTALLAIRLPCLALLHPVDWVTLGGVLDPA